MFYFFKPTFPATKKTFIKSTLGFVAITLRKKLKEKKDDGSYYLESEYIFEATRILEEEFKNITDRLKEVNLGEKKEEGKNGIRSKKNKNTIGSGSDS